MNTPHTVAVFIDLCASFTALVILCPSAVHTQSSPRRTSTVPIMLTREVNAAHAKSGDVVTAKTIQTVWLGGTHITSGTTVEGHVVEARPFTFDPTPYAQQQPSILAIHFDTIESSASQHNLSVSIRALAHPGDLRAAHTLQHLDEHDTVGYFVQIGGDRDRADSERVVSREGQVVGYRREDGVYARLLPGEYRTQSERIECDATNEEQPVAIFSANACGVYGLKDLYITDNGRSNNSGTFRLESFHHIVKVYSVSAALLESIERE
jgi:hypothetical protein